MILAAARSRLAVSSTTTGGLPGPATIAFLLLDIAALTTPGPPVTHSIAMSGCVKISLAVSRVGFSIAQTRLSMPIRLWISSFHSRVADKAILIPEGCGLHTSELPPEIIMIALHPNVGTTCVNGVTTPITPNGACSITVSPMSPLTASLVTISMPGTFSAITRSLWTL